MQSYRRLVVLIVGLFCFNGIVAQDTTKDSLLEQMRKDKIHRDDIALIQANISEISIEQLTTIHEFLSDSQVIADSYWFDVTQYANWDEYNFGRPMGDVIVTNLARRDLFLDPARQLNNRVITNMSDEALATLVFSQTYVEEKWDHTVPWDNDPNSLFNWVQPELLQEPNLSEFLNGDYLYQERVRYWYATYQSELLESLIDYDFSDGNDIEAALTYLRPPISNAPRLAGYSYPIGNQLYLQTAETALWYVDYLTVGERRYGQIYTPTLDTQIAFPNNSDEILSLIPPNDWEFTEIDGLWGLLYAPFADELRMELTHPETASFWNVMRFVHAGARQREGGGSPEQPGNNQPSIVALRYSERSESPVGRVTQDISAFSLITTVYSDSILLDFTNWDMVNRSIIVKPIDVSRSDGINRQLSERNKAIQVVEQIGNENIYPNATHIAGSRGLGFNLITQYDDVDGDFLPYTSEEAYFLVMALTTEVVEYGINASRQTLCNAPLLQIGYDKYADQYTKIENWDVNVGILCS